jgi:hypothetical protein
MPPQGTSREQHVKLVGENGKYIQAIVLFIACQRIELVHFLRCIMASHSHVQGDPVRAFPQWRSALTGAQVGWGGPACFSQMQTGISKWPPIQMMQMIWTAINGALSAWTFLMIDSFCHLFCPEGIHDYMR